MVGADGDGVVGFIGEFDVRRLEARLADLRRQMDAVRATALGSTPLERPETAPPGPDREQTRGGEVDSRPRAVTGGPLQEEEVCAPVTTVEVVSEPIAGAREPEPVVEEPVAEVAPRTPPAAQQTGRVVTGRVIQQASKPQPIRAVVRSVRTEGAAAPERSAEETPRVHVRRVE